MRCPIFKYLTKIKTFLFCICMGAVPAAADVDKLDIQYGSLFPGGVYISNLDKFFADELKKRSDGKINIDLHFSNALGTPAEIIPLIGSGAVGMGGIVTGYHFGELPFASLTNAVPATFNSASVLGITANLFENNETIKSEFDRTNLHPIFLRHLPEYTLICTKPLRTMADLKGIKIRTYGAYIPKMVEAMGAVPVNLSISEMYESLQRGVVDCVYWTKSLTVPFKLHEVAKYVSDLELGAINAVTIFTSQDNWNSWSEDTRSLIKQVAAEATAMSLPLTQDVEKAAAVVMAENGVEMIEFQEKEKLLALIPDMLDLWVDQISSKFPNLRDEALKTVNDIRAMM